MKKEKRVGGVVFNNTLTVLSFVKIRQSVQKFKSTTDLPERSIDSVIVVQL